MSQQDPQQAMPAAIPEAQPLPQNVAAAMAGPDSLRLPRNPLAVEQERAGREAQTDYRALYEEEARRRSGVDRRLKEELDARGALTQMVESLSTRLEAFEKQMQPRQQQQEVPPAQSQQEPEIPLNQDMLMERIAEMEAERYRDQLVFQYMQPGEKGANLPLAMFRENIPVVAPDVGEDGKLNDSGQREAIERFITGLQGISSQSSQRAQAALTEGWTPGVSPGQPDGPPSQQQLLDEYYKVKEQYGNLPTDAPEAEVNQIQARYYALHEQVGKFQPGQTTPWMTSEEMASRLNQLESQLGKFQQHFKIT